MLSFRDDYKALLAKALGDHKAVDTVISCDPGLDDALMLLTIFSNPLYRIAGIIACAGNSTLHHTLNNTLKICELVGREDIAVYRGCISPEGKTEEDVIKAIGVYGNEGLGGIELPDVKTMRERDDDGVNAMVMQIQQRKTLIIATGCLTDVYRALKILRENDVNALNNIIAISIMGGVINAGQEANVPIGKMRYAEANILFDPIAANGVFAIAKEFNIQIILSPLDLTHSILCSDDDIAELKNQKHPSVNFAYQLLHAVPPHYQARYNLGPNQQYRQPLHDVHAAMCLIHPELYHSVKATVSVKRNGEDAGTMHVEPNPEGNVMLLNIHYAFRKQFFTCLIKAMKYHQTKNLDCSLFQNPYLPHKNYLKVPGMTY